MEQLAYFVTKTFEFNNTSNRVFEIINMTTKFDSERIDKSDKGESMDEDDSVDIDITDNASEVGETEVVHKIASVSKVEEVSDKCDKNITKEVESPSTLIEPKRVESPMPLVKKLNRDGTRHVTRNWLIGDCPKKKAVAEFSQEFSSENQENHSELNIVRVEESPTKLKSPGNFRAKPSNELLKQIREINNLSPLHNSNGDLKKELDDEKIKSGKSETAFHNPFSILNKKYLFNPPPSYKREKHGNV